MSSSFERVLDFSQGPEEYVQCLDHVVEVFFSGSNQAQV
jgi:hypothetical protein